VEEGWTARNPGQGLSTTFDGRGFTTQPDAGGWSWGLDLQSYGWGATHPVTEPRATSADGGRFSREWDNVLTEWYVNDARGLEHGFTVASRPSGAVAPLTVDLSIRGELRPVVSQDGRDVAFTDAQGGTALHYNGLTVFDAAGMPVSAKWYSIGGDWLRLQVDDASADYPLTIDPVAQLAYLKASNTGTQDFFGFSVAISGDTVVVGATGEDSDATGIDGNQADNSALDSGAAFVFVRAGSAWSQQAYLKASNTEAGDRFGFSVAISGDTVVVGAHYEESNATGVNGNQADNSAFWAGAAYVFHRSGGVWSQQAYLKASNTEAQEWFGASVAVSGDTVVVGAHFEDSNATGVNGEQANNSAALSGAAYVFVRSGGVWSQQAYLKASNTAANDWFGYSVAVSGDTVVVGAYGESSSATGMNGNQADNSATWAGAAYVFVRSGGVWSQQAYLKASNTGLADYFGIEVALSGDTLVVGARGEDSNATGVNGNQANNSAGASGAAYVFVRSGGVWSQQAYLKASNTQEYGRFGTSVAISGDTVVVGAHQEDSNATGVNGNQVDNSAKDSGAAYVFARSGGVWSQQVYLKASNTGEFDDFGSVAVSGDTVVVGAHLEDSNATGVNGNQAESSAPDSGAAYIFDLDNNPGTVSYGTGTPGCAGTQTLDVTHPPLIGSPNFGVTCNNAPLSSVGFGVLGTGQDLLGSDPFGLGVLLHIDPLSPALLTIPFSSDAFGNALAPAPIPNIPNLVGKTLYAQVLWAWSSCPLPPFGLSTSQGLALTFLAP
jgi:FG-GAP repeat